MSGRSGRVVPQLLALSLILTAPAWMAPGSEARAALLAPRPGPIDRPLAFAVADLNRDGFDDLIVANFQAGTLTLLLNQRDNTFALGPGSPELIGAAALGSPTSGPLSLAVADLNPEDVDSDGVPNVSDDCPNTPNASTLPSGKQLDSGTCVGGSKDTLACQIDPDCPSGFCQGNGVGDACEVMKRDANGNVIGPLDSDGDGVLDFDPNFDPTNPSTALDNCPFAYNPGQEPTAKGPNGVCGGGDDNSSLFGPDAQCGTADDLRSPVGQACATSPDLVILGNSLGGGSPLGIVRVRLNDGAGDFVSRPSKAAGFGASQLILADFTGDGRPDIAQSNALSDAILLFKGQSDGTFSSQTVLTTGTGPQGLASADIDGDGTVDLAVANRTAGTIGIYLSQGGTLQSSASTTLMLGARSRPTGLLAGSFNGDACGDLVSLEQGSGSMCVGGTKDGSGCTLDSECPSGTCSPGVCLGGAKAGAGCATDADCPGATCDTGGSGDARIEVFGSSGCSAGGFVLASAQTISLGPASRPTGGLLRDLDGDGVPDLAITDFAGGNVPIFRGIGDGTFATPAVATLAGLPNPVALATLDYDRDGRPDLAVLEFAADRVDLYHNTGGFAFSLAPTSPASGWKGSSAMAMFGADPSPGIDTVFLHRSPPRLDVLSGIGNVFFRPTPSLLLKKTLAPCTGGFCAAGAGAGSACATDADCPGTADAMLVADVHKDGVPDVIVVDTSGSTLTTLQASRSGVFTEIGPFSVASGPTRATAGSLILFDYDRDGVPDYQDDCPTVYNPPDCKGDGSTNLRCKVDQPCATNPPPLDCATKDLKSGQCDSDGDGVGDQCELLSSTCGTLDSDGDGIPDYSPTKHALDNCPFFANPSQKDAETAAGPDGACGTLDDYPPYYGPDGICGSGDDLPTVGDRIGDFCPDSANNVVAISPPAGSLTVLDGDGTGTFHDASFSPLGGFSHPTDAAIGAFSLDCPLLLSCSSKRTKDILVLESGAQGSSSDDLLTVLVGDGAGVFTPQTPVPAQGDPTALLVMSDQPVCSNLTVSQPFVFPFDSDNKSPVIAALEPASSSLGIYLISKSGLTLPPARSEPLPVAAGSLSGAAFADFNQDGVLDLAALSTGDGDPTTPDASVTIYLGIANGLFYTDPTFNVTGLLGNPTLIAAGTINIDTDLFFPDVVLYDAAGGAPYVLINVAKERADIDGSGRVDGFDLAILSRAFGAQRGEDFTILDAGSGPALDGTLEQTGASYSRVVVGGAGPGGGRDIPDAQSLCNRALDPLTGPYGLPVDINLDGVVDGKDLALLASLFGRSF